MQSTQLTTYQANMERILQWILKLENQLATEDRITKTDLKRVKEQFQKHEVKNEFLFSFDDHFFLFKLGFYGWSNKRSESNRSCTRRR
jgi:hypothetical protein